MVVALLEPVEQGLAEAESESIISVLFKLDHVAGAIGILDFKGELLVAAEDLEVDQITGAPAVDADQPVPGLKTKLFTDRTRLYRCDHRRIGLPLRAWQRSSKGSGGFVPHGLERRRGNRPAVSFHPTVTPGAPR